jgi:Ca-activated chloride channel family protein
MHFIDDMDAAGGTNIGDALKTSASMLGTAKDRPSYLVLMTDGEPTVGETSVAGLLKVVDPKKDIRVFDFGVGYDVNTKLLNKLADDNHGTSQYVEPEENLEVAMSSFYDKIKSPVLSNVKLDFQGIQVKDMYPRNVKDIFAGSQLLLMGKYKGNGNATCHMTGTINGAAKSYSFPLKFEQQELAHSYLPRLWAMRRIGHLTEIAQNNGENREVIDEIVALSKKYGIISNYTSFLVTDPSENHRLPVTSFNAGGGGDGMGWSGSPVPPVAHRKAEATRAGGGALPHVAMGKFMNSLSTSHAAAMPPSATAYASPRAMQMIDERPVVKDFRVAQNSPSAMSLNSAAMGAGSASEVYGDEGADRVAISSFASQAAVTGKVAVMKAKKLNVMRDSISLDEEKSKESSSVKSVDDKTFYLRNGFWTDSAYDASKSPKPQEITFGSKEYFDLLKSAPGISKYLAVGRQVIVVHNGHTYKISFKQDA